MLCAGQGSSALCRSLGSFETRARLAPPPGLCRPIAARLAARPAPGIAAGRGGCYTRDPPRGPRGEPAAASAPSALRAGSGSPAAAGEEEVAPQLGRQQVAAPRPGSRGCLIAARPGDRLPRPSPSPALRFCSPRRRLAGLRAGLPGPGGAFAGGEDRVARRPRRISPLPPPSLAPTAPRPPNSPAEEPRAQWGKGTGTGARSPAGFRRAQLLQLRSRWALVCARLSVNYLHSA